jgi:hypothetical protein
MNRGKARRRTTHFAASAEIFAELKSSLVAYSDVSRDVDAQNRRT